MNTYMPTTTPKNLPAFSLWKRHSLAMAPAKRLKIRKAHKVTMVLGKMVPLINR
jgi:hypothetical protein